MEQWFEEIKSLELGKNNDYFDNFIPLYFGLALI